MGISPIAFDCSHQRSRYAGDGLPAGRQLRENHNGTLCRERPAEDPRMKAETLYSNAHCPVRTAYGPTPTLLTFNRESEAILPTPSFPKVKEHISARRHPVVWNAVLIL